MSRATQPHPELANLFERVRTADRLAALGSPAPAARPGRPLAARLWSRANSTLALLFTARQKRFNIETTAALDGLCRQVQSLRDELTAARAEVDRLTADAEPPHLRPGTMDDAIWTDVCRLNEYALPDRFEPTDVILDIGGHIGSFAFACLQRGAGAVVSYEPSAANAALARVNLSRFGARATVVRAAVWRSDVPPEVFYLGTPDDPTNTGGGGLVNIDGQTPVEMIALDAVLEDVVTKFGVTRVRLLKMDCEGSEYPILMTSRSLHRVASICGEYHESDDPIPGYARVPNVDRFDRVSLTRHLEGEGFRVTHRQHTPNSQIGLFFADRVAA